MTTQDVSLSMLRAAKRQSVTKAISAASSQCSELDRNSCRFHLNKIEALGSELCTLNADYTKFMLDNSKWTATELQSDMDKAQEYDDNVRLILQTLSDKLQFLESSTVESSGIARSNPTSGHKVRLPDIELPSFDGQPESFNKFIVSFESLISKYDLSQYEKFSYLTRQLTGNAKKLVESLSLQNTDYDSAKKLLNDAYFDKLQQQYSIIDKLIDLKLDDNAADAFSWIGDARLLDEQVRGLDISSELFIQYFLWRSLNDSFRNHVMSLSHKTRPSLADIKNTMFEANSRYMDEVKIKSRNSYPDTVLAATSVGLRDGASKPVVGCALCVRDGTDSSHKLFKCTSYPSPQDKLSRIKKLNGCTKCASLSHATSNCNFNLNKKCFKCNGWHMSFLCAKNMEPPKPDSIDSDSKSKVDVPKKSGSSCVAMVSMRTEAFNDVVLPTATVYVRDESNKKVKWRAFKDVGSQSTFVRGTPADIPHSKIIKAVDIKINGINSVETYHTNVVSFPIEIPGQGRLEIQAVCLPRINVKIVAPGLKQLSDILKNKDVSLADQCLDSDVINNFDLLIGSDQGHILPMTQHACHSSVVYMTPAGVMLAGSVAGYMHNVDALAALVLAHK